MHNLLVAAGIIGLLAASSALYLHKRRISRRIFAVVVAVAATSSLFSVLGWAATAVAHIAPQPLLWLVIGALTLAFAVRLYRELQPGPSTKEANLSRSSLPIE